MTFRVKPTSTVQIFFVDLRKVFRVGSFSGETPNGRKRGESTKTRRSPNWPRVGKEKGSPPPLLPPRESVIPDRQDEYNRRDYYYNDKNHDRLEPGRDALPRSLPRGPGARRAISNSKYYYRFYYYFHRRRPFYSAEESPPPQKKIRQVINARSVAPASTRAY